MAGTTNLGLATDVFDAYLKASGATTRSESDFSSISKENYNQLKPLVFVIGNVSLRSPDPSHIPK